METILGNSWYCAGDIARVLEISVEDAEAIIELCRGNKLTPVYSYPDPTHPAINGYTLREIARQRRRI